MIRKSWRYLLFAILSVSAWSAHAQNRYLAIKETSLSGAAEKITVQQPATNSTNSVGFETADIYCSVACEITFSQNGTGATATAMTAGVCGSNPCTSGIIPLGRSALGTATAYSGSNVGTGSVLKSFYIPAAGTVTFDISAFSLPRGAGIGSNFSIGTNSITGTVRIQIQWKEQ